MKTIKKLVMELKEPGSLLRGGIVFLCKLALLFCLAALLDKFGGFL